MKQLLLFALFAIPTLLLAQPTLTFSPADGATDVSTTSDLTITSNQGLKLTDGTNLDDDNVDALISLVDADLNPVLFEASESSGRTVITINPTGTLLELMTYTLTLQPVEGNGGQETETQVITFTTGDFTDPVTVSAKAINNTGDSFTFRVNVNEDATVYYVVDRNTSTPSEAQVRAGHDEDDNTAEAFG